MHERTVALAMRAIRKTYPGVVAVDNADLTVRVGEILALVGENGAGKSTLSAIAFGEIEPDSGTVQARGTVGLVHQHFELAGRLRVWQNVLLGREPRRGWRIDVAVARRRVNDIAERNGFAIDVDAYVDDLPVGVQQRVELLRELDRNPSVVLLDEPTATLAPAEIDTFFAGIKRLAESGTAIVIVTHKLEEVRKHADSVTVMRGGRIVAHMRTNETTSAGIARAMVGGTIPSIAQRAAVEPQPCVVIRQLHAGSGSTRAAGISFDVPAGRIVGIAGVEGNGQTSLADALAGVLPYTGTIQAPHARPGIVPQDRQREALVPPWSIVDNAILGRQRVPALRRGFTLDRGRARADAQWICTQFDVRAASLDVPVRTLSGGNQQKIVVGRALIDRPPFVLAYNPTRGIDVGAAALVHSRLIEARNAGTAILLISFDLDEIFSLADDIHVMYRGAIVGTFSHAKADRAEVGRMMAGGR